MMGRDLHSAEVSPSPLDDSSLRAAHLADISEIFRVLQGHASALGSVPRLRRAIGTRSVPLCE